MPASNQNSLSGDDQLQLVGRNFTAFCDGDFCDVKFPNDTVEVKVGKNGNAVYAYDFRGGMATMSLRLIRASADDKFLQSIFAQQGQDFASFTLITGQFVKRVGDGKGNVSNDTMKLFGGVLGKRVEVKSNAEGDTEQSLAIWPLKFARAERAIM